MKTSILYTLQACLALTLLVFGLAPQSFAYTIDSESTCDAATEDCFGGGEGGGGSVGDSDNYKVTITTEDHVADNEANASFVVNWQVPSFPMLTATATFTVTELSGSSAPGVNDTLILAIEITNTTDASLYNDSIVSLGLNINPDLQSVDVGNDGTLDWVAATGETFPSFQTIDLCLYPTNGCGSGPINAGLAPGETDVIELTITGDFTDYSNVENPEAMMVMLSDFALKFQGDLGSFETPGTPDTDIPEPGSLALVMLGATIAFRRKIPVIRG